jgi:hypothetical protein
VIHSIVRLQDKHSFLGDIPAKNIHFPYHQYDFPSTFSTSRPMSLLPARSGRELHMELDA